MLSTSAEVKTLTPSRARSGYLVNSAFTLSSPNQEMAGSACPRNSLPKPGVELIGIFMSTMRL
jgi:hypothetical protein